MEEEKLLYQGLTLEETVRLADIAARLGLELYKMNDTSQPYDPKWLKGLFEDMSEPKYHAIFERFLQKVSLITWMGDVLEEYMEQYEFLKVPQGE